MHRRQVSFVEQHSLVCSHLSRNWNAQGTKIRDMGEIAPQGLKEYQQRGRVSS